ncbi:MAG: hypothetical protein FJX11_01950 [Alphaproteobacteria bacterium]|nr:hypothetical protein [Alphaproteobacteria bacterium]
MSPATAAADPLSGTSLYADVVRYDGFGAHRYGSSGAERAMAWIAEELDRAGLSVSRQPFTLDRQYDFRAGTLAVEGQHLSIVPQWWLPPTAATFSLTAPIAPADSGPAPGAFVLTTLAFDRGAYLDSAHRATLAAAFARQPAAVLLVIDHPSGEIFTYNVDQNEAPWPVPVILVAPKDRGLLDSARQAGRPVSVSVEGALRQQVPGDNVVGRLNRGSGRWLAVSTPVTSWFTSTCERGPGIAGFLATARLAHKRWPDVDLVFVATAGHEIGHGGMEHFLRDGAPPPDSTLAWAHFGASLACYEWRRDGGRWVTDRKVDTRLRLILSSAAMETTVAQLADAGTPLSGPRAGIGELRDVLAAGYPRFFGMAGSHTFFHTPADSAAATGPEILEPVARAFVGTLDDAVAAGC